MNWKQKLSKITLKPNMMQGEYICRCADALGIEVRRIVEVGVYKGQTSLVLRNHFPHAQLILVDPWTHQPNAVSRMYQKNKIGDWEDIYQNVCKMFERDIGTTILRCPSTLAACYVQDGIDLIFLDGLHEYDGVLADLKSWVPKMRKPCLITGHDYNHSGRHKGVGKAVDEWFGHDDIVVGPRKTWVHYEM